MRQFDSEEMLRSLCEQPVTVLCAPPTAYRALVQHQLSQYPFKALRHCVSAGEPLNPEVVNEWTKGTGVASLYLSSVTLPSSLFPEVLMI